MSFQQLRNVDFGKNRANATGSSGVGYTLLGDDGSVTQARTTVGVYQLLPDSGLYACNIAFPDNWHGQIVWDTGSVYTTTYALEQYNYEENNPNSDLTLQIVQNITGSVQLIRDVTCGRWKIVGNQMIFYAEDNLTEVLRFNLYDDTMVPTMDSVFERVKV